MYQISVNGNNPMTVNTQEQHMTIDDAVMNANIQWQANGQASVLLNNKSYIAQIEKIDKENKEIVVKIDGQRYTMNIKEDIDVLLEKMGINMGAMQKATPLKAPMPGMILKVLVSPGQQVNKGDALLILEAMKMENVLKATADATVKAIKVEEKVAVEKGAILIEME